jgi:hypothetical protein
MLLSAWLTGGCSTTVSEQHLFATYRPGEPDRPVNFFRLSVNGGASFSNARYVAGYYDERAIDLFFNEMKAPDKQRIFDATIKPPGDDASEKFRPLSPTPANGAFLLIMSTNADDIADTIGSFAESQIVAQALTQLVNKDRIKDKARSDVELTIGGSRSRVLMAKLNGHLAEAQNASSADAARMAYTRALHALSQALGNREPSFRDFSDAKRWFDLELAQPVSQP